MRSHRALELKGLALIVFFAFLVWLSTALYSKQFVSTVDVTLHTSRSGLQLNDNGDVRMRGALVGRIVDVQAHGNQAVIHLALDPDQAEKIPANVRARIVPTTLFGQKYIELSSNDLATNGNGIRTGDVLTVASTDVATELTSVLDRLEPLLTAVHPEDLSATLQAVSQGLEGRGDQLGRTVALTADVLDRFEPHLDALDETLKLLAEVSNAYADATPDLLDTLENVTVTAETVEDEKRPLAAFFSDVTELSDTLRVFLDRNGDTIIDANSRTRPVLAMLARYAPEYPCVLSGLRLSSKALDTAFRDGKLHSYATLGLQYPAYGPEDTPKFTSAEGPTCAGLPKVGSFRMPEFDDGGSRPDGQVLVP